MISFRQIRYFLAVAEAGNLSQAAAGLFVAQPALSRQIAALEEELGVTLFVREARGVRLTPGGELFRARMAGVEAELASAADDTRALARGEAGVLRLLHSSSVPLVGPLLAALGRFNRDVPAARVDLDRVASETQVAEVAAGRADVGVARLPVLRRDPAVEFVPLPDERLLVALPAGHRFEAQPALQLADLAGEAFVSAVHRERGGLARRVTDLCLARGFVPRMAPVISRKTSMLTLVGAGFGVAVIPAGMAGLAGDGVRLVPLADADATAAAAILLPRQPSPLAARFAGICRAAWAAGEDGA